MIIHQEAALDALCRTDPDRPSAPETAGRTRCASHSRKISLRLAASKNCQFYTNRKTGTYHEEAGLQHSSGIEQSTFWVPPPSETSPWQLRFSACATKGAGCKMFEDFEGKLMAHLVHKVTDGFRTIFGNRPTALERCRPLFQGLCLSEILFGFGCASPLFHPLLHISSERAPPSRASLTSHSPRIHRQHPRLVL